VKKKNKSKVVGTVSNPVEAFEKAGFQTVESYIVTCLSIPVSRLAAVIDKTLSLERVNTKIRTV